MITVFWILKPIKKGLFIQHYDESGFTLLSWTMTAPQAELLAITNAVAMFVQLVVTSCVMTRFGVSTALLVLPLLAMGGSLGFAVLPTLWMGSLLNPIDNAFSYSINQSPDAVMLHKR